MTQMQMVQIVEQREVSGIEMGVLSDGTAYLTGRGLAMLCGVAPSAIIKFAENFKWSAVVDSATRDGKIQELLIANGHRDGPLYVEYSPPGRRGGPVHAYADNVCMAMLEYYAFEAGPNTKPTALQNFRTLARSSLREFIYTSIGYDPRGAVPAEWRQFHDRVKINQVPAGYFNVFGELSCVVVELIRHGLVVDDHTVPDISVGQKWSEHWQSSSFDARFGQRTKAEHNYPDYFPQAKSNPQPVWIYPAASLGEFRSWLFAVYLPDALPHYLQRKVNQKQLAASTAELMLEALVPKQLSA